MKKILKNKLFLVAGISFLVFIGFALLSYVWQYSTLISIPALVVVLFCGCVFVFTLHKKIKYRYWDEYAKQLLNEKQIKAYKRALRQYVFLIIVLVVFALSVLYFWIKTLFILF